MRIVQLVPSLAVGGGERVVARLAGHLHRWGHTVEVVSLFDPFDTWIEAELRTAGVPMRFLGKRPGLDLRMIPHVTRALARFQPDVLHTHMGVMKYALPALAVSPSRVVVHTLHNLAEHEVERPSRFVQRLAFRRGVVPVAIGEGVAESMRRIYAFSPRHVIPNGIPVAAYAPPAGAREELRASLAIPPDAPTFITVASFGERKNHELLIRAFASQRLASASAHLLLAGDGERRPLLERQACERGAAARIHFLGVRSDIPRMLAAADAFVLPSKYEGNPLSVMEAMAAGKPVIATAVGCVPELVPEGCGRLVPPEDQAALESAMHELAHHLPLARRMGVEAAQRARERFDDAVMARAYERLYQEEVSRVSRRVARSELAAGESVEVL